MEHATTLVKPPSILSLGVVTSCGQRDVSKGESSGVSTCL